MRNHSRDTNEKAVNSAAKSNPLLMWPAYHIDSKGFVVIGIWQQMIVNGVNSSLFSHKWLFMGFECFRCSLMGFDLNRHWQEPSPWAHPTLYATKNLLVEIDNNDVRNISLDSFLFWCNNYRTCSKDPSFDCLAISSSSIGSHQKCQEKNLIRWTVKQCCKSNVSVSLRYF